MSVEQIRTRMPPRPSPTSNPQNSELKQRIAAGNAARRAEAKRPKDRDDYAPAPADKDAEDDAEVAVADPDASEPDPMPSKVHYAIVTFLAIFFISLPLSEDPVEWIQVAAFTIVNAAWIGYFHRATFIHCLVFFLLNFILIQWSVLMVQVPELLQHVDPIQAAVGIAANAVLVFFVWYGYVRKLPRNKRTDAWDWIACVILLANILVLVALGVIPMRVVYQVFKTLVGLLSNFSVGGH
jgi:hypothetical protein